MSLDQADQCEENWPPFLIDILHRGRHETAGYESILLMNQSSVATLACRLGRQTSGIFTQKHLENQNVLFIHHFVFVEGYRRRSDVSSGTAQVRY